MSRGRARLLWSLHSSGGGTNEGNVTVLHSVWGRVHSKLKMVREGLSEEKTFKVRIEWQEGVRHEKMGRERGTQMQELLVSRPGIAKKLLKKKTKLEDSHNLI